MTASDVVDYVVSLVAKSLSPRMPAARGYAIDCSKRPGLTA